MKKGIVLFISITILSALSIFLAVRFCGFPSPFEYSFELFRADGPLVGKLLNGISVYEKNFDDNFYKVASREDIEALKNSVEESPVNEFPEVALFSYPSIHGVVVKMFESYGNVFDAKSSMSIDFPDGAEFAKNYDKLEYNYAAAEAFARIAERIAGYNRSGVFIPDEISDKIILRGDCVSGVEDFEKIFAWYIGYNGLKTSFDVRYFEVMLGGSFLTTVELIKVIDEMDVLLKLLNSCVPPEEVDSIIRNDLNVIYGSYSAKKKLAEYQAFTFFQDDMLEMKLISEIYSARNISSIITGKLGYDAFKTLGSLAVFELYSKNYNKK